MSELKKFREVVIYNMESGTADNHYGNDNVDSVIYIEFKDYGIEISRVGGFKLNFIPYNNILNINYGDNLAKVCCKSYWRR